MKVNNVDVRESNNNLDSETTAKKLATGPRTEVGKRRSSRNATRHGLFANSLIEGESRAGFCALVRALREDLGITGATGELLVEKLAFTFWRQARHYRAERAGILRLSQLNDRFFRETLRNLNSLGSMSPQDCQADFSSAEPLHASPNETIFISQDQLENFTTYERHFGGEIDRIFDQLERVRHFKKLASARSSSRPPS